MEKNNDLPVNEDYGAIASQDEKRRSSMAENPSRAVRTVVFIIILCLGLARVTGVFEPKDHVPLSIAERAKVILSENPLIDGHNDLMIFMRGKYQNHIYDNEFQEKFENGGLPQHVDIPRLEKGMQGGAFWSAFWPCPSGNETDFSTEKYAPIVEATLGQLDLFHRLGQQYPKYFTPSRTSAQALKAFANGLLISPTAIEGLHQIGNSISTLRLYHQLGVRYATLTWNCHNKYADAALQTDSDYVTKVAKPYWHGLSPDGRALLKEMNRLGMLVDLSHVSQDTMRDALVGKGDGIWNGSLAPPIFSHSSAYAVCPHPRNVPDDILQLVKKRNSVVMVNFAPEFVSCKPGKIPDDLPEVVPENATLKQVVKHIMHIGELIGYDHVGIGTDYDGIDKTPSGLEDVSKFPDLIAELLRQGVSDEDAAKVAGRNVLRVWAEADKVAEELQKTMKPLEDDVQSKW
ncbi:dipeptidase [Parastagonospora nodorum]|nr:dipeptidase [Parastagonospora nodorum]KAH4241003.1 dipeptidase [Parastagonospora nodorum]KAH5270598.1 dipeptidase [Parastagonospora nodorum]KAH5378715.1 dipeptidase [Parastagonospora nodorum]KAH5656973.1 dipeptidase [Parastagonospora nodorum]